MNYVFVTLDNLDNPVMLQGTLADINDTIRNLDSDAIERGSLYYVMDNQLIKHANWEVEHVPTITLL